MKKSAESVKRFPECFDPELEAEVRHLSAKARKHLAKKLDRWAADLRRTLGIANELPIHEIITDYSRIESVFEALPKAKHYPSGVIALIAKKFRLWVEELDLEIKRRDAELTNGNPQN